MPDSLRQTINATVNVLGGRWRLMLVYCLLNGPKRFSDLQKDMGIAVRLLRANLRVLEEAGLVVRTAYAEVPPRVEYGLTPEGYGVAPANQRPVRMGPEVHRF